MLSIKQGGIKYHFLAFWYGATWDWTQVYQTISAVQIDKKLNFKLDLN